MLTVVREGSGGERAGRRRSIRGRPRPATVARARVEAATVIVRSAATLVMAKERGEGCVGRGEEGEGSVVARAAVPRGVAREAAVRAAAATAASEGCDGGK